MEHNGVYMMQNNYEYSKTLLHYCQVKKDSRYLRLVGGDLRCRQDLPVNTKPRSTFMATRSSLFDQYVRRILPTKTAPISPVSIFQCLYCADSTRDAWPQ